MCRTAYHLGYLSIYNIILHCRAALFSKAVSRRTVHNILGTEQMAQDLGCPEITVQKRSSILTQSRSYPLESKVFRSHDWCRVILRTAAFLNVQCSSLARGAVLGQAQNAQLYASVGCKIASLCLPTDSISSCAVYMGRRSLYKARINNFPIKRCGSLGTQASQVRPKVHKKAVSRGVCFWVGTRPTSWSKPEEARAAADIAVLVYLR